MKKSLKFENESKSDQNELADAIADLTDIHALLDELVLLRRASNKTQLAVASEMGVSQSTVAGFESEMSNPRLSTLQRYARVIGVRIRFKVEGRYAIRNVDSPNRQDLSWSDSRRKSSGYSWVIAK